MDSHLRPNNYQGFQNGSYNEDTFMYHSGAENDFNPNSWEFNPHNEVPTSSAQPTSSYLNWPQPTATAAGIDSYGQSYSRSPANLQQTPYSGYGDSSRHFTQSPYDPSLVAPSQNGSATFPMSNLPYGQPQQQQSGTIAPHALENGRPQTLHREESSGGQIPLRGGGTFQTATDYSRPPVSQAPVTDQTALVSSIPRGHTSGSFSIIDYDKLVKATGSRRLNAFINVGQHDFEYAINRAAVPAHPRRKSRNELRRLAGNDPKLLARLGKKQKTHSSAFKAQRPPTKQWQPMVGVKYEGQSSSEESSDEDDSSEYSEDELAEPSPLPPRRPDSPLDAVKYDTIKALWQSKRFQVDSDMIRTGLKDYWEVVRTIRDRWKTDSTAVTDAEMKKRIGELPLLKSRVKDQRDMIEVAFKAALEYGHPSILELSGENAPFLYLLYQFLLDRFKENDFEGPLSRSILEILAICTTLTEETLEKTRLSRVLERFAKKGNLETQALVKRIDTKASENTRKKVEEDKLASTAETKSNGSAMSIRSPPKAAQTPSPAITAGMKRSASDSISDQAPKRVASGLGPTATAPGNAVKTAAGLKRPSAAPGGKVLNGTPSGAQATKPKLPTAPLAMGPTAKKPNTKAVTPSVVASTIKSIEKKVGPSAASAAAPKPAFSFAATMANLTKPKEKQPTPKATEEKQPPETAEQKAKRLRKEQRRKLRVTFKPDNQLEQVKYFTHDVDEELGHDASMIRDVADVGGEGRMFKQHKDMTEADEDDDGPSEEDLKPFRTPGSTDFSDVDPEERKRNYIPYGGGEIQPESPEKLTREQRDQKTLMVVYSHPSDIPPCPREPAEPYNGIDIPTRLFGLPDSQSTVAARLARLGGKMNPQQVPMANQAPATTGAAPDISAILALINPQQTPQQVQQPPQQPPQQAQAQAQAQNPMAEIQRILANLPQSGAQAQPPTAPTPQAGVPPNLASIFANLQPQGNNAAITPQIQSPQKAQVPGMDPNPANLAAFFSQLNQNGAGAAPINPFGSFGMPGGSGFPMANLGQIAPQQQYNQTSFENEERRRYRESGGDNNNNINTDQDDGGFRGGSRPFKSGKGQSKPWVNTKQFTQPCKYFKTGKCQKGANCTYLHE